MLAKLKQWYPQFPYQHADERRAAQILFALILAVLATYLVVILTSLYRNDWELIWFAVGGAVLQTVPLGLLARGHLRSSSFIAILGVLGTVTLMATIGQGMHDIAIMAFPVIIIISSLMMQRRDFTFFSLLTIGAVGWLVFGEVNGWFIPRPLETTNWADFIMMAAILLVATMAMNLLATSLRESLDQAQREIAERKRAEEQLRYQSTHDILTGVYNRAFFEAELARLERSREFPVSVVVADVDKLKVANDTQGHAVGDELLRRTATVLQSAFRAADILARIGGDEFAILLPDNDSVIARKILTRVKTKLAEHNAKHPNLPVQLSLGVATAEKDKLVEAFQMADRQMYADKSARQTSANQSPARGDFW